MRFPMRARGAPSAMAAVVAALALATGGVACGTCVVGGDGSTADVQPDKGTRVCSRGDRGRAARQGHARVSRGRPASCPGPARPPPGADSSGDVDKTDLGVKGVKPSKDRGVKNAAGTTG